MATTRVQDAARELRDRIDANHAVAIGAQLGCTVTIVRRVPVQRNGKFTGLSEPVFQMPAEFIEQAQALGLLAEAN